jgi:hypothetical protein
MARFNMRIGGTRKNWLKGYAKARSTTDSQVVTELLLALREGRLEVAPPESKKATLDLTLPDEVKAFLGTYAAEHDTKESRVVDDLLAALNEGRIEVKSAMAPNPFPADSE